MAKGGGKMKGRPRKTVDLVIQSQTDSTPAHVNVVESSHSAGMVAQEFDVESLKQHIELENCSSVTKQSEELGAEGEKEATTMQIEEREAQPMRNRGMSLGYIVPLIKEERNTAKLCISELEKESENGRMLLFFM